MVSYLFTIISAVSFDDLSWSKHLSYLLIVLLQEIGAIAELKEVASSPDEVAAKFASEALTVIGEEVPYKLSQQVPCWSTEDVQYWVKKVTEKFFFLSNFT